MFSTAWLNAQSAWTGVPMSRNAIAKILGSGNWQLVDDKLNRKYGMLTFRRKVGYKRTTFIVTVE